MSRHPGVVEFRHVYAPSFHFSLIFEMFFIIIILLYFKYFICHSNLDIAGFYTLNISFMEAAVGMGIILTPLFFRLDSREKG
jgi:hypothetical protein